MRSAPRSRREIYAEHVAGRRVNVFAQYQDYMRARNLPVERRLHCHGQGYENVERPLIRYDETMTVAGNMNIGIHPAVTTEVCS